LDWTSHKPQRRARQRNDKEVERWKADEFPRILREAWRRGAHIAFLDESGFMLMPLVRRTLAPRGQRVTMRCSAKHDRVSAISCVTLSPQAMHVGLYSWLLQNRNFHGEEVVEFLQYLTGKVPGEWTVVWDGNNIRVSSRIRGWAYGFLFSVPRLFQGERCSPAAGRRARAPDWPPADLIQRPQEEGSASCPALRYEWL
jgi:hypothetical protein